MLRAGIHFVCSPRREGGVLQTERSRELLQLLELVSQPDAQGQSQDATGLDMGMSCIRFKKADQIPTKLTGQLA